MDPSSFLSSLRIHCCFLTSATHRPAYTTVKGSWQLRSRPIRMITIWLPGSGIWNVICSCLSPVSYQPTQVELLSSRKTFVSSCISWRLSDACTLVSTSHSLWYAALIMVTALMLVVVNSIAEVTAVKVVSVWKNKKWTVLAIVFYFKLIPLRKITFMWCYCKYIIKHHAFLDYVLFVKKLWVKVIHSGGFNLGYNHSIRLFRDSFVNYTDWHNVL